VSGVRRVNALTCSQKEVPRYVPARRVMCNLRCMVMHCPTLQLRKPRVESRNALINLCTRVTQAMTMIATTMMAAVVAMMVMIVIVVITTTTTMAILSIDVTSEVGHLVWRAMHSCARCVCVRACVRP
jgi:hypothetical protein